MIQGDFDRAELCFQKSEDVMSLFLIYSSLGNFLVLLNVF